MSNVVKKHKIPKKQKVGVGDVLQVKNFKLLH